MDIGIYSGVWTKDSITVITDKMLRLGIDSLQLTLASLDEKNIPETVDYNKINNIKSICKDKHIKITSLSGNFNIASTKAKELNTYISNFENLMLIAKILNIPIVTLCTGSMSKINMWTYDKKNESREAWNRMLMAITHLLSIASKYDIVLGIIPHSGNIVRNAKQARKLLDYFSSPFLKIVIDGAALLPLTIVSRQERIINEAFELLEKDIVLAYARDYIEEKGYVDFGEGRLDFNLYMKLLKEINYKGSLIMHNIKAEKLVTNKKYLDSFL